MRISKETSAKSLKYFGDILHCTTKKEIEAVRKRVNTIEKQYNNVDKELCKQVAKLSKGKRKKVAPDYYMEEILIFE